MSEANRLSQNDDSDLTTPERIYARFLAVELRNVQHFLRQGGQFPDSDHRPEYENTNFRVVLDMMEEMEQRAWVNRIDATNSWKGILRRSASPGFDEFDEIERFLRSLRKPPGFSN